MTPTPLTITHRDIVITYQEYTNDWHFTLRGRERSVASVKKAKEAIDKPVPKKSKTFEIFEAWLEDYGDGFKSVTVLSIVEKRSRYSATNEIRVREADGDLRQKNADNVYPKNAKNDGLIRQIAVIDKERNDLEEKRDKLILKLTCVKIKPETETP